MLSRVELALELGCRDDDSSERDTINRDDNKKIPTSDVREKICVEMCKFVIVTRWDQANITTVDSTIAQLLVSNYQTSHCRRSCVCKDKQGNCQVSSN